MTVSRSRSRSERRSRSDRRGGSSRKAPKRSSSSVPRNRVLVKNLSSGTTLEHLRDGFGRYGPIKDVYMPRDHYSGRPRGIAFVEFEDGDHADDAVAEMDNTRMLDNYISCCIAKDRRKSPQTMQRMFGGAAPRSRSRGRGGGGGRGRESSRSRGRRHDSRDFRRR